MSEKKTEIIKEKKSFNRTYKKLIFIPIVILTLSILFLAYFFITTGDFINRDITLTGGTVLTITTEEEVNIEELTSYLKSELGTQDVVIRTLKDIYSGRQLGISIESTSEPTPLKEAIISYGIQLKEGSYSTEVTGSGLSQSFYKELLLAILIAFVLMGIIVFIIFRKIVPSLAVILSAFTDIFVTLAIVNLLGVRISTAGIAAFLMLIGYSVDTDIMLTTKLLKRRDIGPIKQRLKGAFKTGLTMTLTSIAAMGIAYFVLSSPMLKQVFLILTIGLCVDLMSTWLANGPILKSYADKKHIS